MCEVAFLFLGFLGENVALESVFSLDFTYAYRDRKDKKRNFRALWIQRINAAARMLRSQGNQSI